MQTEREINISPVFCRDSEDMETLDTVSEACAGFKVLIVRRLERAEHICNNYHDQIMIRL